MPRLYIASVLPASAARSYQGRAASGFGGFEWAWRSPEPVHGGGVSGVGRALIPVECCVEDRRRRSLMQHERVHGVDMPGIGGPLIPTARRVEVRGVGLIRVLIPAGVHGVAVAATRPSQPTHHFNSPQRSLTNWRRTAGRIPACGSACCRGAPSPGCSRNRAGPAVAAGARPARTGSPSG
jgi:hypothetical protein